MEISILPRDSEEGYTKRLKVFIIHRKKRDIESTSPLDSPNLKTCESFTGMDSFALDNSILKENDSSIEPESKMFHEEVEFCIGLPSFFPIFIACILLYAFNPQQDSILVSYPYLISFGIGRLLIINIFVYNIDNIIILR